MRAGWRSCTTTASRSTVASSWGSTTIGPMSSSRRSHWIEAARLECATFHILTPYPGTPLFRQMESEGRLLHKDWRLYDTSHAVYRPRHMSPEKLEEGYAWCYERLFSHASIWRRRPADWRAVPPYLAMSYLYKRSNRLWHLLIQHRLTGPVWRPLVECTRRRHLTFRRDWQPVQLRAYHGRICRCRRSLCPGLIRHLRRPKEYDLLNCPRAEARNCYWV